MITASQLRSIAPGIKIDRSVIIAAALDSICPQYGINTPDIFHEFLPNLLVECMEFTRFEENLNYSPKRLMQVWPKRFPDLTTANQMAYNKEKLANYVYGSRLGNNRPGDGWLFRGSGPIQATGRENITKFTRYYNKRFGTLISPEQMAELLRTNLEIGIHSACWFFAIAVSLIDEAINDEMLKICERINGGHNGLPERMRYYERTKKVII